MKRLLVLASWLALLVWARPAMAKEDRPTTPEVVVAIVPQAPALADALRSRLERRKVRVRVISARPQGARPWLNLPIAELASVWLDVSDPKAVKLVIVNLRDSRYFARRMRFPDGPSELANESLGIVVETAIDSLLRGRTFSLSSDEAASVIEPQPARPPPAAPESLQPVMPREPRVSARTLWRLRPLLEYGVGAYSSEGPRVLHGPGLSLMAQRGPLRLAIAGGLSLPARFESSGLDAELSQTQLRARAELRWLSGDAWALWSGVSAGANRLEVSPSATGERFSAAKPEVFYTPVAGLAAGLPIDLAGLLLEARLYLDLAFFRTKLVVERLNGQARVLSPWSLRPGAQVGLSWN